MFSDIKSRLADLTNCIGRQEVPEVEANEGTMVDKPAPQKAMTADQMKKLLPDIRDAERISEALGWRMRQCFGDKGDVEDITEADIISTVEFDQTGNYLATGDKGGRVVLFERNETKKTCEYKFHTEFQSHEPEFDYLKSLEIEEKINKIKWCRRQNASHYLLSTNDKTIKLWKVFEKSLKVVAENNLSSELTPAGTGNANGGGPVRYPHHAFRTVADLKFPRMTHHDTVVAAVPRRVYANAHAYHINSISVNSDGETFISSDDLRINLWNLNIQDQSFNIVDIKPANMEELTEVITAAEFHPTSCNWFMYASSKGTIKLADMRQKALCDEHAKQFEQEEDPSSRSFFSEIISSISDVRFSHDGRYILSRDYLTVKIWDVNMERQPVKTIPIHEHLRPRLCDTYENDSIFDKFEVVFSGDAKNVMTGSYNNNFMIYPSEPGNDTEVVLQADKSAFKAKKVGIPTPMSGGASPTSKDGSTINKKGGVGSRAGSPAGGVQRMKKETDADQIDFNKKILHMSWHPQEDSIAIAATNNLFVFSAL
ncbi:protein phosphatase 2A regulatory subunit cdc55 [Friedmanniomyces endolithicus]|uniref:Protein phosphatase PP2A regulatory subunit B n=1 Tax=Friedmanniomyces endolithicus TaxID=329885 RepID=A0AAN6K5L2_9PEZI|nr:protein phosphatase 2A regulatory subunit cdc55 [Friedmanniomyces endolithicus]KAK0780141.1 protein phosphatase 2A regulatory subunit cdc55 [Friedmanniomyces endolithicus]KAK0788747.1 protein phosphatase 2A regulatory subunit cdc55 [Friedmanniomyces endolithicus]KAK0790496.1 protein phosphatase 2A regulatory subunit cdc55 [Friedmanniomyces endolithicus]KAK0832536.1 protein phosphatase 2A regulatory subunit cdc55 [Friedmanniomyces endolithicus]